MVAWPSRCFSGSIALQGRMKLTQSRYYWYPKALSWLCIVDRLASSVYAYPSGTPGALQALPGVQGAT